MGAVTRMDTCMYDHVNVTLGWVHTVVFQCGNLLLKSAPSTRILAVDLLEISGGFCRGFICGLAPISMGLIRASACPARIPRQESSGALLVFRYVDLNGNSHSNERDVEF